RPESDPGQRTGVRRGLSDSQTSGTVPVRRHCGRGRAVGIDSPQYRLVDRLNRRRSAGGRAVAPLRPLRFDEVLVKERFDCFRGTSKERVALKYGVVGVNVYALKPR